MIPEKKQVSYDFMVDTVKACVYSNLFYGNEVIQVSFDFKLSDVEEREIWYNHVILVRLPETFIMTRRNKYIYFKNDNLTICCEVSE